MKKWILALVLGAGLTVAHAQPKYTLQQAVDIAVQNNLQLKQSQLQVEGNRNNFEQSRYNRYPNLNFNGNQGVQTGRNIDPFTNQFVERAVNFSSFNINSGMTLFSGYQIKNTIKQNGQLVEASQKDVIANRNTLTLNVATAYLNVLNNEEQLSFAQRQVETTRLQLNRTQRLVDAGTLPQVNLYDIQSQLANDELAVINAQNNIELAKLTLKQLMNLPASESFNVVPITLAAPSVGVLYDATLEQVYNAALKYLPDLEAAELRIESAKTGVEIAKGAKLPTLSLNAGAGASYSSAAPNQRFVSDGGEPRIVEVPSETRFVQFSGIRVPVFDKVTIPSGSVENFGYFRQLDFNRNFSLGLNLRVPIFNAYRVRYNVANAQIQQRNADLQYQIIRNQVRQTVEQAYYTMLNAAKRYEATSRQVESLELSFKAAESRLNAGSINSVEYNVTKNNLDRARISLVQAKYDYIFRTKILDFYQSKPLTLD